MSGILGSAGSRSGVISTTELDYEEGTWTPVYGSSWSTHPTPGNETTSGRYRKVGKIVVITFQMMLDQTGADIAQDDRWYMEGLPFLPLSQQNGQACGNIFFYASMGSGNNAIGPLIIDAAGTSMFAYIAHVDGTLNYGTRCGGTATYITA